MNSRQEEIEKLLERFYAASLSSEEMQSLYTYFLYTNPLPDKFKDEAPLLQELGIRYFCQQDSAALESKIDKWYEEDNTTTRTAKIISLSRTATKRIAVAAACVAVLLIGLWQVGRNFIFVTPASEDVPPQYASVLIAQNSDEHSVTVQEKETPQIQYTIIQDELHATSRLTTEQNTATDEPTHQYASAETATTTDTATENLIDTMPQPYIETTTQSDYYLVYNETTVSDDKVVSYCSSQCSRKTMMDILTQVIVM